MGLAMPIDIGTGNFHLIPFAVNSSFSLFFVCCTSVDPSAIVPGNVSRPQTNPGPGLCCILAVTEKCLPIFMHSEKMEIENYLLDFFVNLLPFEILFN